MNTIQSGLWAGLLATGPMTLTMLSFQKTLPAAKRSPLPPATISSQLANAVGIESRMTGNRRADLSLISHLGYGLMCGALYAITRKNSRTSTPILRGALFGLSIWSASYLGWIPAVGLRASAWNMPSSRNGLMVISHLVWGACLGFFENELSRSGQQLFDGRRKAPQSE